MLSSEVYAGRSTVRDFDFRRPRYALHGTTAVDKLPEGQLEEYRFLPGHSAAESSGSPAQGTPVADRDGAYRHLDKESAARAERRVDALRAAAVKVAFNTSVRDLAPGAVFSISGHPHPDLAHRASPRDVGAARRPGGVSASTRSGAPCSPIIPTGR